MGRLIIITTPDVAPGFQLAGVETFEVESGEKAEAILRELLAGGEASLIAVHQDLLDLLQTIAPSLRRQLDTSYRPVVMALPGGAPSHSGQERRRSIAELIQRAIGFHITFDPEGPPEMP